MRNNRLAYLLGVSNGKAMRRSIVRRLPSIRPNGRRNNMPTPPAPPSSPASPVPTAPAYPPSPPSSPTYTPISRTYRSELRVPRPTSPEPSSGPAQNQAMAGAGTMSGSPIHGLPPSPTSPFARYPAYTPDSRQNGSPDYTPRSPTPTLPSSPPRAGSPEYSPYSPPPVRATSPNLSPYLSSNRTIRGPPSVLAPSPDKGESHPLPYAVAQQPPYQGILDIREDLSDVEEVPDSPLPGDVDEGNNDHGDQGFAADDIELAVLESIHTERQMQAKRETWESNRKVNQEIDAFLQAVRDVTDDDDPPPVPRKREAPAECQDKGKQPVIDLTDGDE